MNSGKKVSVCVTIGYDTIQFARQHNINISAAAERGIVETLRMPSQNYIKQPKKDKPTAVYEAMPEKTKKEFTTSLTNNINYAKGWRNKIMIEHGLELSKPEIMILYGRLKKEYPECAVPKQHLVMVQGASDDPKH